MEKLRTSAIIVLSILIGIFGYLTYNSLFTNLSSDQNKKLNTNTQSTQPQEAANVPIATQEIQTDIPTIPSSLAPSNNWQKYTCVPLGFSITHPADLNPQKQGETIVFSKWGPSQKEGTEFYDGISLSFSSGFYNNIFDNVVRQKLQEATDWPNYVSSTDPQALTMSNREAWIFEVVSMGKSKYIFVKKSDTEYLEIVDSTKDPTRQGFENTVTQMLDSLQID